jgi:hypothetical protein
MPGIAVGEVLEMSRRLVEAELIERLAGFFQQQLHLTAWWAAVQTSAFVAKFLETVLNLILQR